MDDRKRRHRQTPGEREIACLDRSLAPAPADAQRNRDQIDDDRDAQQIAEHLQIAGAKQRQRHASDSDRQPQREGSPAQSVGKMPGVDRGHRAGGRDADGKAGKQGRRLRRPRPRHGGKDHQMNLRP